MRLYKQNANEELHIVYKKPFNSYILYYWKCYWNDNVTTSAEYIFVDSRNKPTWGDKYSLHRYTKLDVDILEIMFDA